MKWQDGSQQTPGNARVEDNPRHLSLSAVVERVVPNALRALLNSRTSTLPGTYPLPLLPLQGTSYLSIAEGQVEWQDTVMARRPSAGVLPQVIRGDYVDTRRRFRLKSTLREWHDAFR